MLLYASTVAVVCLRRASSSQNFLREAIESGCIDLIARTAIHAFFVRRWRGRLIEQVRRCDLSS